ncbi:zinc finger protein [Macleaya cordata]|uniref:RING-type E3 ubiquitin transferase n=1 Tax=Macleaya cordata TaxID=56857 RepID=A0A200PV93_MACCD|nr:zinc finger protein [Macleaya cordata]
MEDYRSNNSLEKSQVVDVSSKVMLAAIIVLFLVIVFVIFLHLYAKWYWSRREENPNQSSGTRRRRFVFSPSQDPVLIIHQGLEPSVIKSLPLLTFNPDEFKDGLECAVCLSELSLGEKARLLPKCNHGFHVDCIDMWFQSHSTCPICRNPISVENSSPELPAIQSPEDISTPGYSIEAPNYPTNVLFWGNQTQVIEGTSSSSQRPSSSPSIRQDRMLVIEVPERLTEGFSLSSPSTSRFSEEDLKSPMTTRFRSLRRLLSREKRVVPCSPGVVDLEQGEGVRGQSSKTSLNSSDSRSCYTTASSTGADRLEEMNI